MATNIDAVRKRMETVNSKQQAYEAAQAKPISQPQTDNNFVQAMLPGGYVADSVAKNANVGINNGVNPPYAKRVNEARASATGGSGSGQPPIKIETPEEKAQREQDMFKKGVDETTKKFQDSNKSNMDTYTANENARREAEAEAIRARVRAAIAQGTQAQNKIISDAPAQFVDPMNRTSFQGANNARAIDERMVAMGLGRSGSNITAQTSNNNQTSGNINDLENTKAKVISNAQAAIANLQASGSLQEVAMVQEAAAKSLERLQAQQNIIEGRDNEQANLIFQNSMNALKTSYNMGVNERQLGMQEKGVDSQLRTAEAGLTGIDPKTGLATADMQRFTKTFNADEAKTLFDQAFRTDSFDYQKTRDTIADNQYDTRWAQELDNIAYSRSENNPAVKAQIINNAIADIEKSRMLDNNSPENQLRYDNAAIVKKQLADLMAISPEMKVKEFNAGLDQIYQNIAASKASVDQGWASVNNKGSTSEKFDTNKNANLDDYKQAMNSLFVTNGFNPQTGQPQRQVDKEGQIAYIKNLMKNNEDVTIVKSLIKSSNLTDADFVEQKAPELKGLYDIGNIFGAK